MKTYWNVKMRSAWTAIFLLGVFVLAPGCKKVEDDIGLSVQPEDDQLSSGIHDTLTLTTYTVKADSLRTDELASGNLLGSYVDPVFGHSAASFFAQLRMESDNVTFYPNGGSAADIVVDSIVLSLVHDNYYGNLDAQTFRVYEVTEDMELDSAYYSNQILTHDNLTDLVEVGMGTLTPDPFNGAIVANDTIEPQLRIKLDNSLGDRFVNLTGTGFLDENDGAGHFVETFKGIYVTVDNSGQMTDQGGILYFDALHANSKVTMYYRDTVNLDTNEFDFIISDRSPRYTVFEHDYTGTAIEQAIADSTLGQETFYIQAMAGVETMVHFPHIQDLVDSGVVAINRAELVIPAQYFTSSAYLPHDRVFLFGIAENGEDYLISDWFLGDDHINGFYDDNTKSFNFTITRYIQEVLAGTTVERGLRILSSEAAVSANRSIINGQSTTQRAKPYLKLTYTDY
jgi:hypothetical protein